jgi:hypothetical protein
MAVGISFLFQHAILHRRRVLVHCAQGRDRSVAVILATIAIFSNGPCTYPLEWNTDIVLNDEIMSSSYNSMEDDLFLPTTTTPHLGPEGGMSPEFYQCSGLTYFNNNQMADGRWDTKHIFEMSDVYHNIE